MKLFKSITCGIACLTMCLSFTGLNANAATTYKKGDVNGDGVVNSQDTLCARKFVLGIVSSDGATSEKLDANKDYVIDENDVTLIKNIVFGLATSSTVTSTDTTALPSQENRLYYIFDGQTGQMEDYYTLNNVSNISTVSTHNIIGIDDRYIENNLNGVVNIGNNGTGFVIGPHTILTAAHCVSNKNTKTAFTGLQFMFYSDNNTKEFTVTPSKIHVPSEYIDGSISSRYDYALVTVEEDLSNYICFNLGAVRDNIESQKNPDVYVTGFGWDGNNDYDKDHVNPELIGVMSTGLGKLSSTNSYKLYYNTDTVGGDSGGPIYLVNGNVKTVIGIHTSGGNSGIRITTDILHFVYNNSYLN